MDPRKEENLKQGSKTVWANVGSNQFHLPEGKPDAQVLQGVVTLVYSDLSALWGRFQNETIQKALQGSKFDMKVNDEDEGVLLVIDPWGTKFRIISGNKSDRDTRGRQPGEVSEGLGMRDITIYTPIDCNLPGIGRFYEHVLNAPILETTSERCVVSVGPQQTLTFQIHPKRCSDFRHDDLRNDNVHPPRDCDKTYRSNYGPHLSVYVADLASSYRRADELGVVYVNPRFKRQAYSIEEAIDDCMFRCLDIVDPKQPEKLILRLEHEVRSVVTRDGTKYKSCPFDSIPDACTTGTSV